MSHSYETKAGIEVEVTQNILEYSLGIDFLLERLDEERGAIYASSYEYPGRYKCWDIGFVNPPIVITSAKNYISFLSLNLRGDVLLEIFKSFLINLENISIEKLEEKKIVLTVNPSDGVFTEEQRSKRTSVFTIIRACIDWFYSKEDSDLGLYGAYGYDLIFQLENLEQSHKRDEHQDDMVIYLPDELYVVNHQKEELIQKKFEFKFKTLSTVKLPRDGIKCSLNQSKKTFKSCDHNVGEYVETVLKAKEKFSCGDLFEVVPSQTFVRQTDSKPSELYRRLKKANPAPYGFFINLGNEHLIGASPEMYVRVTERRIETCPISGTIKRGNNPIEDAKQIACLLNSQKECAELTMCTDVDRNDKSRICIPGSVKVIGRRQIEMYSKLIHTVDHVEGVLAKDYDAVDAFLTHMWVVTVTGAPKLWAMRFIEEHEKSPRKWYGGAVGWFNFNGNLNTGLTLRTIHYKHGIAEVRVGATLLYDSVPEDEEAETRLKGSALLETISKDINKIHISIPVQKVGENLRVLLIDHDDSFVHTLANYIRQTGAEVTTYRHGCDLEEIGIKDYDLLVLSPGPGNPKDFNTSESISIALKHNLAIFGVCLGLQAIVEHFGGELSQLSEPVHGKTSNITTIGGKLLKNLPQNFVVGRYHSLYAAEPIPDNLAITSRSEDNIIMSIEHKKLPIYAVQFHPETILSTEQDIGIKIIEQAMRLTRKASAHEQNS